LLSSVSHSFWIMFLSYGFVIRFLLIHNNKSDENIEDDEECLGA